MVDATRREIQVQVRGSQLLVWFLLLAGVILLAYGARFWLISEQKGLDLRLEALAHQRSQLDDQERRLAQAKEDLSDRKSRMLEMNAERRRLAEEIEQDRRRFESQKRFRMRERDVEKLRARIASQRADLASEERLSHPEAE